MALGWNNVSGAAAAYWNTALAAEGVPVLDAGGEDGKEEETEEAKAADPDG